MFQNPELIVNRELEDLLYTDTDCTALFIPLLHRKIRRDIHKSQIKCGGCNSKANGVIEGERSCPYCFTEDAFVTTKTGYKSIKDVKVGEKVLSINGTYDEVLKTFERDYDGELISIKSFLRAEALTCTADHRWFVIKKNNFRFRKFVVEEVEANALEIGDYLLMPKLNDNTIIDLQEITINERKVALTSDLLWTFGLWCAEGHIHKDRDIYWSLHIKEEEYALRVEKTFTELFPDCNVRHYLFPERNVRQVAIAKSDVARWFAEQFGSGCENKRFPDWLMHLPKEKSFKALEGLWAGDGSTNHADKDRMSDRCSIGMTSRQMIYQAQWILWQNARYAGLSTHKTAEKRRVWRVEWVEDRTSVFAAKGLAEFDNFWGTKIREIVKTTSKVKVYDLKVDNSESFVVNNTLTHNCDGVGYLWDEVIIKGWLYTQVYTRKISGISGEPPLAVGESNFYTIFLLTDKTLKMFPNDYIRQFDLNADKTIAVPVSFEQSFKIVESISPSSNQTSAEFNISKLITTLDFARYDAR